MAERERLIEIFKTTKYKAYECTPETTVANQFSEYALSHIIDEFLKKGVMVPPCRVGDKIWCVKKYNGKPISVYADYVQMVGKSGRNFKIQTRDYKDFNKLLIFGKTAFLLKEEAEKALKERENNA